MWRFVFVGLLALLSAEASAGDWKLHTGSLNFPEGPAWDGKDALYVSSCKGEFIERLNVNGGSVTALESDKYRGLWQRTNGLAFGPEGALYACEWAEAGGAILRLQDGEPPEVLARLNEDGEKLNRPNDLAFGPDGTLYFTDPNGYDATNPDGSIYRLDLETRTLRRATEERFSFPNGIAFTPQGHHLILAESAKNRLLRFAVFPDGSLGEARVVAELPGGDPDGMAFDADGNLYVAHFGGGHVWVFGPDMQLREKIATPGSKPSNVEFGGPDLGTLYLTECETNAVYEMPATVRGLPLLRWE